METIATREPRQRLNEGSSPVACSFTARELDGTQNSPTTAVEYPVKVWNHVMNDFITKDFAARKRKGEIINNAVDQVKEDCRYGIFPFRNRTAKTQNPYVGWDHSGEMSTWRLSTMSTNVNNALAYLEPSAEHKADLIASQAVKAEAKVTESDVNLAQTVAEFHQSVNMYKNLSKALRVIGKKGIKAKALALLKPTRTNIRAARDAWLAFRYGLMPSIRDYQGMVEAVGRKTQLRHTARTRFVEYDTSSEIIVDGNPFSSMVVDWNIQREYRMKTSAGVLYDFISEYKARVANIGCNQDLFTLGWEITPYSFVIDWFINVGEYLEAVAPRIGVNILCRWTTQRIEQTVRAVCVLRDKQSYYDAKPGYNSEITSGSGSIERIRSKWERNPYSLLDVAQAGPQNGVNLDIGRSLDLLALLSQASKSTGYRYR